MGMFDKLKKAMTVPKKIRDPLSKVAKKAGLGSLVEVGNLAKGLKDPIGYAKQVGKAAKEVGAYGAALAAGGPAGVAALAAKNIMEKKTGLSAQVKKNVEKAAEQREGRGEGGKNTEGGKTKSRDIEEMNASIGGAVAKGKSEIPVVPIAIAAAGVAILLAAKK